MTGRRVIQRLAVDGVTGADHRRVADVDDQAVDQAEHDPSGDQNQQTDPQHARREPGSEPTVRLGAAQSDPEHPHQQVHERRVGEPHRGLEVSVVEQPVGQQERQHHERIQVPEANQAPEVEERDQEQQRKGNDHPG